METAPSIESALIGAGISTMHLVMPKAGPRPGQQAIPQPASGRQQEQASGRQQEQQQQGIPQPPLPNPPKGGTLGQLKTVHSQWDRKRRDHCATLALSKQSQMTKGSQMEEMLEKSLEEGNKYDSVLLGAEIQHNTSPWSSEQE